MAICLRSLEVSVLAAAGLAPWAVGDREGVFLLVQVWGFTPGCVQPGVQFLLLRAEFVAVEEESEKWDDHLRLPPRPATGGQAAPCPEPRLRCCTRSSHRCCFEHRF